MADSQTSAWILEFLLRQPIEDYLANELFFALPLTPPLPLNLSRTILLRRLASDLSRRRITTRTLHSLELLHHLSHSSTSLRRAYAAAAFHLAAAPLRSPRSPSDVSPFIKSATRIFRRRVADLIGSPQGVGLVSDDLIVAKRDVEAAMEGDPIARVRIMARETEKEAIEAVRSYIKEAAEMMGPSFLELAAEAVQKNGVMDYVNEAARVMGSSFLELAAGAVGQNGLSVDKHVAKASDDGRLMLAANVFDKHGDQNLVAPKSNKFDPVPTPLVGRAKEALKTSCKELHMVVEDPLPDAIKLAAAVLTGWKKDSAEIPKDNQSQLNVNVHSSARKTAEVYSGEGTSTGVLAERVPNVAPSTNHATSDPNDPKGFVDKTAIADDQHAHGTDQVASTNNVDANGIAEQKKDHNVVLRPSLMDRNRTAHTIEWDDSIDSPSDESPTTPSKVCLPSPKKRKISPLTLLQDRKFVRRRKNKRWSTLEEDTLREAVKKHGKGNWKTILSSHPDIFEERTEVDLKDKWRNMTR